MEQKGGRDNSEKSFQKSLTLSSIQPAAKPIIMLYADEAPRGGNGTTEKEKKIDDDMFVWVRK